MATGSAAGVPSTITATNVDISLGYGGNDVGVSAASGGQATLTGGSVTVPGVGGGEVGLRATGAGSVITATDVPVSVTGGGGDAGDTATNGGSIGMTGASVSVVNGAGGLLQNGGSVTMTGADVTASGNGGFGFLFNGGGSASTLQYSNGTITASDASFSVQGSTANIGLTNTTATANNNTLLETTSSGSAVFDAQGSTLQGVITTDATSTSTVNLTNGTVWTMTGNSTPPRSPMTTARLFTPFLPGIDAAVELQDPDGDELHGGCRDDPAEHVSWKTTLAVGPVDHQRWHSDRLNEP